MKKFLILILICSVQSIFSQTKSLPEGTVSNNLIYSITGVEVKPEFPGGITEFNNFLDRNFIKPVDKPALKGKIYATFVIEKDGSLSDFKVIKDLGYGTGDEAIRVLKIAPKWIPGKHKGKEVRTLNSVAITVK